MKAFSEMTAEELHKFRIDLEKKVAEFSAAVDDYAKAVNEMKNAADTYEDLVEDYCNEMNKI